MAISWASIRSLVIFFGPILLPKAISYYRTARNTPRQHGLSVRPAPPGVNRSLALLFAAGLVLLILTLPLFAPENLFVLTQSRLQIPVDTLFNRVASVRSPASLTPRDLALRARFVNLESRLLYLQLGPGPLADCLFCNAEDPTSYFYYAVPDLVAPHLANLVVLALATSSALAGRDGRPGQWRPLLTIAAVALCLADLYLVQGYNYQANSRALRLNQLDFFHWTTRTYRLLALAALDALGGWLIWLSATNRAFAVPPAPAERVETASRALHAVKTKMSALGIVKNTAIRDEVLRARSDAYWAHEARLMREVMEERDVVEGVNDALQNRLDITRVERDAEAYAQSVLLPLQPPPVPPHGAGTTGRSDG